MRFKIKTLFIGVGIAAIASIFLNVITEGWQIRQSASRQLRTAGASTFEFNDLNYLSYVSFTKDIVEPGLPEYVRIDRLDLTGCADNTINLEQVRNANIWHLMLASTRASDDSMRQLGEVGKLRILDISNTDVSDAAVESIASIKGLEGVYLTETKITLPGAEKLKQLRPEIWLVHESIDVAWAGGELPRDAKQQ